MSLFSDGLFVVNGSLSSCASVARFISICFRLFLFRVRPQFVSVVIDEYRTERKCTKPCITRERSQRERKKKNGAKRYCEFCSITTIDKLQFMRKLSLCQAGLWNRLEFGVRRRSTFDEQSDRMSAYAVTDSFLSPLSKHIFLSVRIGCACAIVHCAFKIYS